jgi:vacuolar-type H+-ATPase subunit E/Vma4
VKGFGSLAAVTLAIQEDARAEVERIDAETADAIARLVREDAGLPVVVPDQELRLAAARRMARERLAEEDWADRRAALEVREHWTAHVAAEGDRRIGALPAADRRTGLLRLACHAAGRIAGDHVQILVSPSDAALADPAWQAEFAAATGKTMAIRPDASVAGGCIVRSADGRTQYDNTFAARARRFQSTWRPALGRLFDQPSAPSTDGALAVRR